MRISASDFKKTLKSNPALRPEIISISYDKYIITLEHDDKNLTLCGWFGRTKMFTGLEEAKNYLGNLGVDKANLRQLNPHNEMVSVGAETKVQDATTTISCHKH